METADVSSILPTMKWNVFATDGLLARNAISTSRVIYFYLERNLAMLTEL